MSDTLLTRFVMALSEPFVRVGSVAERVFAGYLVGAALIASIVWASKLRGKISLGRFLFPKEIWLHPSSLLDWKLVIARSLLGALILGPMVVSSLVIAVKFALLLSEVLGPGPGLAVPPWLGVAVFSLVAFLCEDLFRYITHRLMHRVPALWELHKVHHSAEVLTPFTVYRTHPIESVVMRAAAATGIGIAAGVCTWLLRGQVSSWEILGVQTLSFVWNLLGSNLRHSHLWLSYPWPLGAFFY